MDVDLQPVFDTLERMAPKALFTSQLRTSTIGQLVWVQGFFAVVPTGCLTLLDDSWFALDDGSGVVAAAPEELLCATLSTMPSQPSGCDIGGRLTQGCYGCIIGTHHVLNGVNIIAASQIRCISATRNAEALWITTVAASRLH